MNNAVFGKTMEEVRNYQDIRVITNVDQIKELTKKPNYDSIDILDEHLALIHMKKTTISLNKPIYCGVKILDLSKVHMYQFFYEYLKPKYGDNVRLLYMDTDSFIVEILTENVYKDMLDNLNLFDTSDYDKNHPCYSIANKKVIGKFKDELAGAPIIKFCGVRSKMYGIKYNNENKNKNIAYEDKKEEEEITKILIENGYTDRELEYLEKYDMEINNLKAKGIKKAAIGKQIVFETLTNAVENQPIENQIIEQTLIVSKKQQLYTIKQKKIGISWYDDKRYMLDKINQLPLGHYRLKHNEFMTVGQYNLFQDQLQWYKELRRELCGSVAY
jgi:hypothetical protein